MEIEFYTTYIKLCQFLKLANIIVNGGEGKILIQEGLVKVNGSIEYARGKKLFDGDVIEYENQKYVVVNKNVDKNTAIN